MIKGRGSGVGILEYKGRVFGIPPCIICGEGIFPKYVPGTVSRGSHEEHDAKKHDFLVLRHPQKPRGKNKQKSAQKAMQVVSSFGSLFRYFWIFSDVFFSCFF